MSTKEIPITLIGVGGCGNNILNSLEIGLKTPKIALNTDIQALKTLNESIEKIQIGRTGLGAGMNPQKALMDFYETTVNVISEKMKNSELIVIIGGLGGGTGSAIVPEIAKIAKDLNKKTITINIFPFFFEGKRKKIAQQSFEKIKENSNLYIKLENDLLIKYLKEQGIIKTGYKEAINEINKLISKMIEGLVKIISHNPNDGDINVDFNDLRSILEYKGKGILGYGEGKNLLEAYKHATDLKLIADVNLEEEKPKGIIVGLFVPEDYPFADIGNFMEGITKPFEDADVIFGTITSKEVAVSIIATGFENKNTLYEKVTRQLFGKECVNF